MILMLPLLYSRPRPLELARLLIGDGQILLIMQNLRLLHLPRQMFTLSAHELPSAYRFYAQNSSPDPFADLVKHFADEIKVAQLS